MLAIILGTRPEIIKLAPVIREASDRGLELVVLHTNQHYSEELDALFFEELELRPPDANLGVGSGSHGLQTGRSLERLEGFLRELEPGDVIVQGDTNSGLAGALATAKLPAALSHIEAGLRSFDLRMPEEINRRVIDHVADHLFPPTRLARDNLVSERVPGIVHPASGNTIVDAVLAFSPVTGVPLAERKPFILFTLHRAENVDDPDVLAELTRGVGRVAEECGLDLVFPAHPRTLVRMEQFGISPPECCEIIPPTGYRELLSLQATARLVMTDSGGLQDESCILRTPCVTLRLSTERPETVSVGANIVVEHLTSSRVVECALEMLARTRNDWAQPFGDGRASVRILDAVTGSSLAAVQSSGG